MLNYVRAELYKVLRRKYLYITLAVVLFCAGFLVWGWWLINGNGNDVNFQFGVTSLLLLLSMGLYATVLVGDMVFSEQYKYNTLKNEVSFGLSRSRIFFGKLIVQVLVALALCAIIIGFYLAGCALMLYHDATDAVALQTLGRALLGALPLWLGAQALTNAVFFNIKGEILSSSMVVLTFAMLHNLVKLLSLYFGDHLMFIYNYMPTVMIESLPNAAGDWSYIFMCWVVGAFWFIASSLLGLWAFRHREIS